MRSVRNLVVVALVSLASAGIATAGGTIVLGDLGEAHEGIGQSSVKTSLALGKVYTANKFPVAVKIHTPGPQWEGGQLETGKYRFIQLVHLHVPGTAPSTGFGYITLESGTTATPSVSKTVANVRATPHLKTSPTKAITVAGRHASMFKATVTANDGPDTGGTSITPFTVNHHCGFCTGTTHGEIKGLKVGAAGQLFRIIVLQVHGRTVVIYVESTYASSHAKKHPPTQTFPTFLPYAQKMLAHISFS